MKKVSILFLIIFFWGCSNSKQMQIYNPYPEKEITLEKKNVSCSDTSEKKIWYGLYGSYQLNTLNMKDVFPSPDYSYKVEQISTSGDRIISVFTGLFFSISRKTLKIYSCKYSKPNSLDENNRDLIHSLKDAEITTLQEEVSSLKNKITEIETSIKVVPPIPKEENLEKKTGQIPSEDEPSISSKRENLSSESAIKDTPNYPPHSYILFRSNSSFLRKQERKKLANISDLLQKKRLLY